LITLQKLRRENNGPWQPGVSGNPGGRPKRHGEVDIGAMARAYAPEALKTLVHCLRDERYKLAAAVALLDRGFGKPHVSVHTQSESTVLHLVAARETGEELLNALMDSGRPTLDGAAVEAGADDVPTE
jgi:hypothetical protein